MLKSLAEPQYLLNFRGKTLVGSVPTANDLREAREILVIRLDEIGDVVLSTGFFRELRRCAPKAAIDIVVSPNAFALVERDVRFRHVFCFRACRPRSFISRIVRNLATYWFARRYLRSRAYEFAFVPRWDADIYMAAPLAYLSGATQVIGYSESVNAQKAAANPGFNEFFSWVSHDAGVRHESQRPIDLLRGLGFAISDESLGLVVSEGDRETARSFLEWTGGAGAKTLVAVAPFARQMFRSWPLKRYAHVCRELHLQYGAQVIVIGGEDEHEACKSLTDAVGDGAVSAAGMLNLAQVGAVLTFCHLFIGSDSGPAHIAAAVECPTLIISSFPRIGGDPQHPNSPARFRPWCRKQVFLQPERSLPPCRTHCEAGTSHCILQINTEDVLLGAQELLHELTLSV